MQQTWDERYGTPEYVYGKEPNKWFREFIDTHAPGRILLPGEGEGRNAAYAARHGWAVDALDQSANARAKALALAAEQNVVINYWIIDLLNVGPLPERYDAIGLIFIHKTPAQRDIIYPLLKNTLRPGGFIVLEAFTKEQLKNTSGGPKDPDMLFSREELLSDFRDMDMLVLTEHEEHFEEGLLHRGVANTIRMIAQKRG